MSARRELWPPPLCGDYKIDKNRFFVDSAHVSESNGTLMVQIRDTVGQPVLEDKLDAEATTRTLMCIGWSGRVVIKNWCTAIKWKRRKEKPVIWTQVLSLPYLAHTLVYV